MSHLLGHASRLQIILLLLIILKTCENPDPTSDKNADPDPITDKNAGPDPALCKIMYKLFVTRKFCLKMA
jgi:hypothetical protein